MNSVSYLRLCFSIGLISRIALLIVCFISVAACSTDRPEDGRDWQSLSFSEKEYRCCEFIYWEVGLGNFPTNLIKRSTYYYIHEINEYYHVNPLDESFYSAMNSVWPRVHRYLARSKSSQIADTKIIQKHKRHKSRFPEGIGTIRIGDSTRDVFQQIYKAVNMSFSDVYRYNGGSCKYRKNLSQAEILYRKNA